MKKSVCRNCAQKEVGCYEECADRRAERKQRRQQLETPRYTQFTPLLIPQTVTINDLEEAARRIAYIPITIK